jgi:hypothetical protein
MRTIVETSDVLQKKPMVIGGLYSHPAALGKMPRKALKATSRKQLLKYKGAAIWEGNLDEMRMPR